MEPVHSIPSQPAETGTIPPRVMRAAREFEAILLDSLLEPLEHSFSSLPGADDAAASENYHYLGIQALSQNLSGRDPLGIAHLISRSLLKSHQ